MAQDDVLEQIDVRLAPREAERLAEEGFGLLGRVQRLAGERDQNFRLRTSDGVDYLLKISNSAEPPAVTDLQTRALLHMHAVDPDLPTPRLQPARNGEPQHSWTGADGRRSVVRLFSYLQGAPLYRAAVSPDLLTALGGALARVDLALRDFRHPAENHDLLWDVQHAGRLRPLTSEIDDPDVQRLAIAGLAAFAEKAAPRLPGLRAQFIHNDLNPHNVLVAENGTPSITGVLDLGDAVRAPLVDDLAVAAAYHVDLSDDPLCRVAHLMRGYHRVLPLTEQEIEVMGPLILGRLAMSATISTWRARRHPDNRTYILRNLPAAVLGLRRLLPLADDMIAERLWAALEDPGS
ncbi:MAG: phosphotransferase [Phenylobacterium sp.]|uniref:phosphotransferase n=1 Tax=Phenylobacterium sp. TaxID=1871053 RepID=UPI0025ED14FC|nr:phosphotransferase [Phenylobacterium sp.]MBI1199263.1 phosphotransferase [Phenylobacterium sp.]